MRHQDVAPTAEDLQFAVEQSEKFATHRSEIVSAVLTALMLSRLREGSQPERMRGDVKRETPNLTATELFARLRPKQDIDRALSAAYFLDVQQEVHFFTSEDVRKCLHAGKVPSPANVSLALLANARKGLLAQSDKSEGKRNSWFITQSGLAEMERRLSSPRDEP